MWRATPQLTSGLAKPLLAGTVQHTLRRSGARRRAREVRDREQAVGDGGGGGRADVSERVRVCVAAAAARGGERSGALSSRSP